MKYSCAAGRLEELRTEAILLFVPRLDKGFSDRRLRALDKATGGALTTLVSSEEFTAKEGEIATIYHPSGYNSDRVLLIGLGEPKKIDADTYRKVMGTASRHKSLTACAQATLFLGSSNDVTLFRAAAEGYLLGSYSLRQFKTGDANKNPNRLAEIIFAVENNAALKKLKEAVTKGQIIAEGQNLVRLLAATPSNFLTPRLYAKRIQELAKVHKLECQVLDEKAIAHERMGCLLSVAQGSSEPPRFVILRYTGRRDKQKPIVLVGKGVTFDSGGISLKPGLDMHEMKGDMTGSAVMLSTMITASQLRLPLNLVALLPLTENMPSGTATRPGDIITSRKGLTVEIINTDAEGRLILADALDYANTFNPQTVIDIATLTGAALYVLGYAGAPVLGNNSKLMDQLRKAASRTAERVWEMPIWDDYRDQMKSSIADLVNSGGKAAGTLAASAFLENFIGDWPWAHIDIAFVDVELKGRPYIPKGATGIGLRLLVDLLINWKPVHTSKRK